jgi:hypothetical protein
LRAQKKGFRRCCSLPIIIRKKSTHDDHYRFVEKKSFDCQSSASSSIAPAFQPVSQSFNCVLSLDNTRSTWSLLVILQSNHHTSTASYFSRSRIHPVLFPHRLDIFNSIIRL